jgi:L,D-peptidoglycan transpeptidase YkuD (ErfK/YbiS/YcfS/YnhG family)
MRAIVIPSGLLTIQAETFRAALGRSGVRADKHEGDGATPAGVLPLRHVLYRADRGPAPHCTVPVQALKPDSGWCDDPTNTAYNRPVRLPVDASAEALWRDDAVYDIIGVLGWNDAPAEPGRGSAIFLHVAQPDYAPTAGCVALAQGDLRRVLAMGLLEIVVRA